MAEIQTPDVGQHSTSCEVERCLRPAQYLVSATWSIADFVDYELCAQHAGTMLDVLAERKVDGRLPAYLQVHGPYLLEDLSA